LNDYEYINTLSDENFEKYFEKVELSPIKGFDLKPGDLLFIDTIERIHLVGDLIGRISGRSTFSRFGLSVHCTQDKFSSGINSVAPLQIKNNSSTVLKIFPYQKLAQLIIEKTSHNENPYDGTFSLEDKYKLPVVKDSDREQYDPRTRECINRLKPRKNSMLKKHSMSAKFNSFMQAILGFIVSVGVGICGLSSDKIFAIVFVVILAIIYISVSIYFFVVSDVVEREK
jgi:deoxycytidine triphosphate deaminase